MKLSLHSHGSLWLATPHDDETLEHLLENTGDEAQWLGNNLAIEPRFVEAFAEQAMANGIEVAGW